MEHYTLHEHSRRESRSNITRHYINIPKNNGTLQVALQCAAHLEDMATQNVLCSLCQCSTAAQESSEYQSTKHEYSVIFFIRLKSPVLMRMHSVSYSRQLRQCFLSTKSHLHVHRPVSSVRYSTIKAGTLKHVPFDTSILIDTDAQRGVARGGSFRLQNRGNRIFNHCMARKQVAFHYRSHDMVSFLALTRQCHQFSSCT